MNPKFLSKRERWALYAGKKARGLGAAGKDRVRRSLESQRRTTSADKNMDGALKSKRNGLGMVRNTVI